MRSVRSTRSELVEHLAVLRALLGVSVVVARALREGEAPTHRLRLMSFQLLAAKSYTCVLRSAKDGRWLLRIASMMR
jgi:hypothetical protein